jgi:hypothetical protein
MTKKPCRICRRWFMPDAHAGQRQRVCSAAACQSERRRRNAAAWRETNAEDAAADSLRSRLQAKPEPSAERLTADPLAILSPRAARIAVGPKVQVVLEEYAKVVLNTARIAVTSKTPREGMVSSKVPSRVGESQTAGTDLGP